MKTVDYNPEEVMVIGEAEKSYAGLNGEKVLVKDENITGVIYNTYINLDNPRLTQIWVNFDIDNKKYARCFRPNDIFLVNKHQYLSLKEAEFFSELKHNESKIN